MSANCARKKRNHLRKNLVHPRQGSKESGKGLRRRVTEFRLTMTERRDKEAEEEDDADVVCASGTTFTNFMHFRVKSETLQIKESIIFTDICTLRAFFKLTLTFFLYLYKKNSIIIK